MSEQLFKPSRALTFNTVQSDCKYLQSLFREPDVATLRLDLSDVDTCDSAGLALLIEVKRLCMQHQRTLVINKMPEAILALAKFCGVETMLGQ